MRPPEMEFRHETKVQGLKNAGFCCERCGIAKKDTPEGYLEIHHKAPIHYLLRYYPDLSPSIVRSIVNLEILCISCHEEEHNLEDYHYYKQLAQALLGLSQDSLRQPRKARVA